MAPAHGAAAAVSSDGSRSLQHLQQHFRHWPRPWSAFPRRSSLPLPRCSIGFSGFLGSRIDQTVCSTSINVGDKVQKGQVICIVEAMKLMNEIEADQTGTIVKILAEHGKPVSVDSPLFAIKP